MSKTDHSKVTQLIFLLSILTAVFWVLAYSIDVYHFTLTGAIFELLWLPMIALIFGLPIIAIIFFAKEAFKLKSLSFYSLLVLTAVICFLIAKS